VYDQMEVQVTCRARPIDKANAASSHTRAEEAGLIESHLDCLIAGLLLQSIKF
jgi:hypothetical protein